MELMSLKSLSHPLKSKKLEKGVMKKVWLRQKMKKSKKNEKKKGCNELRGKREWQLSVILNALIQFVSNVNGLVGVKVTRTQGIFGMS